ncbi:PIG-L deacetylase family protein [Deinococcus sp.]|uniref:PIG-L deacetylase family protein n=1 Tax=Deinococcus sp. TaxID=47478 RepID=UPI0025E7FBEB|nr:PIG-L deacetylase family protein [Deinococcus sp.]
MPRLNARKPNRRNALRWGLVLLALLTGTAFAFWPRLQGTPAQALAAGQELLAKKTVLAVVAHPDDLEWYIGGTLRELANRGADVQVVVATDGEKGPNRVKSPDLAATRRAEQAAAGTINGYTRIHSLGLPDRGAAADPRFLPDVTRIYGEVKPDAVFVFDPAYPALPYLHVDHQGSAREFLKFWDRLPAGRPPVYLFQTRRPGVAVDISTVIDTKAKALAQHVSQNGGGSSGMTRFFAADGGRVGVAYAELFRVLR